MMAVVPAASLCVFVGMTRAADVNVMASMAIKEAYLHADAREPGAGRELLEFLSSPAAAPAMKRKGMEPV